MHLLQRWGWDRTMSLSWQTRLVVRPPSIHAFALQLSVSNIARQLEDWRWKRSMSEPLSRCICLQEGFPPLVTAAATAAAPVSWRLTSTQMVDSDTFLWHIPSYGTGSSSVLEVLWDEEQLGQIPRSLLRIAHILEELSQAFACMIFEISMQMEHLYCKHKSPHDLWSLNAGMIFEVSTAAKKMQQSLHEK